jgi:hypothetical protein
VAEGPARELAGLDRLQQDFVLHWGAVIARDHAELANQFITFAARALRLMDLEAVESWLLYAMDLYDKKGQIPAIHALREVEEFAANQREKRAGAVLEDIAGVLERFVCGLNGRTLGIAPADCGFTDTETLFLPPVLGRLPDKEANFRLYKAMTVQDYADEIPQTRKAWDLRGAGDWGLRTDPKQRADLQAKLEPAVAAAKADLVAAGLFRLPETEFDDDAFTADVIGRCDMLGLPVQRTPSGKVSKAAKFLSSIGIGDLQQYRKQPEGYVKNTAKIRELVECAFADVPITANGNVATARKWLRESDNEHLVKLADVGEAETILNTFIPALSPPMLHPNHNPLVASGRVSVSKPNINNMPRYPGVREIIVARPGYAFVDADYTQAELAGLAQICLNLFGFSRMAEIINTGRDLHCAFGAQLLGITYDEFVARYDAGDKACKDARQLAKCFNFGAPGGLGAQKFSVWAWDTYRVRVTPAEVRVLKAQWLQTFPEIQLYFQWVNQQIGDRGVFTFAQHVSGRLRGGLGFCDGCNTGFQGLIADGAARALALFNDKALYDPAHPAYGARVVAQIYDEILVETPLDRVHETGLFLRQAMIDGMNAFTPDVPAKVTLEAMYRWTKNAKYKTDDLGRLVPFDTPPDYSSSALTGMTGAAS